ncbi:unnamed protein product [Linum trigynum]|uniref:Uncharacterized protein n=1 Tax=Linum trigynum TaxID=586398 RepID=A0AAV2DU80_9ROSI
MTTKPSSFRKPLPVPTHSGFVSAKFAPTRWGNHFLSVDNDLIDRDFQGTALPPALQSEYEILKRDVRKMVIAAGSRDEESVKHKLRLIDQVQRLGVGYHFESEIEDALGEVLALGEEFIDKNDLYHVTLRFRLLRQQGFHVSPDGLKEFKDSEGNFKSSLVSDEHGVLSLYEAAHLAVHGEDILDEALAFATETLGAIIYRENFWVHKQVNFSLSLPIWKCDPRTLARSYIDIISEHDESHETFPNNELLRFAKLDFNVLQKCHQRELCHLFKWWGCLEVPTRFPYARDRIMECYYWINSVYYEQKFHSARIILTKIRAVVSLIDDTFHNFGKYEDLEILTKAIRRFDISAIEELPEKMKEIYRVMINLYDDIEVEVGNNGSSFGVDYAKEELKKLCELYLVEVSWRDDRRIPTMEEYMMVSYQTSGYPMLCTSAFLGMGVETATEHAFEWVTSFPKMVKAISIIGRLQNDLVSPRYELNRKYVPSAVECYMAENGCPKKEAMDFLWGEISKAWKDIAEEIHKPTPLPVILTDRVLNFGRSNSIMYGFDKDCYTDSYMLQEHLGLLFVHPMEI